MESYFKAIDKLRDKFDNDKPLTLREVCWILWAERYVCSHQYLSFTAWCKQNGFTKKAKWGFYSALFDAFASSEYEKNWKNVFYSDLRQIVDSK